ncbi:MAG: hypothetical protein ACYC5H_07355 [Methylovirgula sp.]
MRDGGAIVHIQEFPILLYGLRVWIRKPDVFSATVCGSSDPPLGSIAHSGKTGYGFAESALTLTLEHVPEKLNDFSDKNMLQLIDFERFPLDRMIPSGREENAPDIGAPVSPAAASKPSICQLCRGFHVSETRARARFQYLCL